MIDGKIVKINKDIYTVSTTNGVFLCSVRGKLKEKLVVGDNVIINNKLKTIEELKHRKNSLIRPLISNIDKLFIVTSTHIPEFSTYLLDKFLILCEINKITPIIIVTKLDKIQAKKKKEIMNILKYYKKLGYKIYKNTEIRKIKKEIKNSAVALAGQTGAGKSTLLNKIDKKLNLKTDEVSVSLGRGKHTTRLVELFSTCDGLLADTPGFSALDLDMTKEEIKASFIEFGGCKYNTCSHIKEEGCNVKQEVKCGKILNSRYENYISMIGSVEK